MRILVVGAGAVGGYFGGRLLEKGEDVTFLVRAERKKQLDKIGLVIESIHGNVTLQPNTILAGQLADPFDIILLSTKAYHLEGAIDSFRQYVGEETLILPLLNGMLHFDKLTAVFGAEKIIGGLCFIESTLDRDGHVIQSSQAQRLLFGERSGEKSERILKLEGAFSGTKADILLSDNIYQELWHKYLFIATMSGITTLLRAPIGPIRDEESGRDAISELLREIVSVMKCINAPIADEIETIQMRQIDKLGYQMKSSMQRDMEKNLSVEADHLHGYLLEIARKEGIAVPVLETIYANLKVYERMI